MSILFKHAFRVNISEGEQGLTGRVVGYFTDINQADMAAKGQGWYGGNGHVTPVTIIQIDEFGSNFELVSDAPVLLDVNLVDLAKQKRREALAKLTPEEISILGIK